MSFLRPAATLPLTLLLLIGCSSGPHIVPVKGVATRGGQPVKGLLLTFSPEGDGRPSTGQTDEQGRFELKFDKDTKGALVGKHKVAVTFRPRNPGEAAEFAEGRIKLHPDQDVILEKFGNRDTTTLSVDITDSAKGIELKLD
jgi:hypothetical protein